MKVSEYVTERIKELNEELGTKVDPYQPSHSSRLELALSVDAQGGDANKWLAMEIMEGRHIGTGEESFSGAMMLYRLNMVDRVGFYKTFQIDERLEEMGLSTSE